MLNQKGSFSNFSQGYLKPSLYQNQYHLQPNQLLLTPQSINCQMNHQHMNTSYLHNFNRQPFGQFVRFNNNIMNQQYSQLSKVANLPSYSLASQTKLVCECPNNRTVYLSNIPSSAT